MIKKIGKAFLRIEHACSAFLHVLKAGGINTIKVNQVQKDDVLSGKILSSLVEAQVLDLQLQRKVSRPEPKL